MDTNDDGTVDYWEMRDWYNEKSTMSLHNAILWSMASLFQQGGERHPKSWSGTHDCYVLLMSHRSYMELLVEPRRCCETIVLRLCACVRACVRACVCMSVRDDFKVP